MNKIKIQWIALAFIPYFAGAGYVQMSDYLSQKTLEKVELTSPKGVQMDGTIGEIRLFAGNFVPRGWAFCHGQLMSINQNSAAFSILGTTYGGDGRNTFGLPDLRGRVPVGQGAGPGLSRWSLGQKSGSEAMKEIPVSSGPSMLTGIRNVAQGKPAIQSSNYSTAQGLASAAVDANTNGDWAVQSVTHTKGGNDDYRPWWEVDLGANYKIERIEIYNRSDCCADRLENFNILVDGKKFIASNQSFQTGQSNPMKFSGNLSGRKVRVQIYEARGILSLAEVRIYGSLVSSPSKTEQVPSTMFQPSLGMNYIICLQGVYPSRN